ncbi:MAG: hypothetical protein HY938_08700 [Nitrosomonadales bacterium]|nr:hypothetical protein [Nitrosomonadales bacterium]
MAHSSELDKQRNIVLSPLPDGQFEHARHFLSTLADCKVELGATQNTLRVSYNLLHHTLEELENRLVDAGFLLDHSMLHNIERNIIYYCEDTIRHNMDVPVHPTKKNEREVFVKAYGQEPHGDMDDSSPESSGYK